MEKNRKKIMIIDDEMDILQLAKDILEFNGYETYDFISPKLALDNFKQDPSLYDLILLDIRMNELDGREAYRQMKHIDPSCRICVFTGMNLDYNEFRKICPSFEEQQLLRKPITVSSLVTAVGSAVGV